MNVSRTLTAVARWLTASAFLIHGIEQVVDPGPGRIESARAIHTPRPELAVRLNGSVMVFAGLMLALGYRPRTGAAVLAASMMPTTLAGHPYWHLDTGQESDSRAEMRIHFIKNASLTGALVLIALSAAARPSGTADRVLLAAGRSPADISQRTKGRKA